MKIILIIFCIVLLDYTTAQTPDFEIGPRISNGEDVTDIEKFPYQVGIKMYNADGIPFWCGGSILSNIWILTAAHCLVNMTKVTLYLGTINRLQPETVSLTIDVNKENFIIHDYDTVIKARDIALIKLNKPIKFSKSIKPIDLIYNGYSAKDEFDNKDATISGWGAISNDFRSTSYILQTAIVKILPEKDCQKIYNNIVIKSEQICTSATNAVGVCKGDSGGPLVIRVNGKLYQIGIAAFMQKNGCESSVARVFTRVSEYLNWVCSKTGICQMYMPKD